MTRARGLPLALSIGQDDRIDTDHIVWLDVDHKAGADRYVVSMLTDPDRPDAEPWTKARTSQYVCYLEAGSDPRHIIQGMKPQPGTVVALSKNRETAELWVRVPKRYRARLDGRHLTFWMRRIEEVNDAG